MAIVLRSTKGSRLTVEEIDGNFSDLDARVIALEGVNGSKIGSVSVSAASFTLHMVGADSDENFDVIIPLPVAAFNPRGVWLNSTAYSQYDVVEVRTIGTFVANVDHISAASPESFDPDATDGSGGDTLWTQIGGVFNTNPSVQEQSGTALTLALTDANTYNRMTNALGCTVTVPANADVAFETGAEITFRSDTSSSVVFVGGTGVTINAPHPLEEAALPHQGAVCTLKKIDTNEWDYIGVGTELTA